MGTEQTRWTHPSVRRLAGDRDPIEVVVELARGLVIRALDAGWSGPPFDPVVLATDHLGLKVVATDGVEDAQTVPSGSTARIEFNPNRPQTRRRYSIAHEIAHTLFPDYKERVRHRGSHHAAASVDDRQLEILCNLAAAEILMPIGSLPALDRTRLTIDRLVEVRPQFDVSFEALLLRAVRVSDTPCAGVAASLIEEGASQGRYRIDYVLSSSGWKPRATRQTVLPTSTCVAECTAIAFTARGDETWAGERLHVECIGIPAYPWSFFPRVAGLLFPTTGIPTTPKSRLQFVVGDALRPRGPGRKILTHLVNDGTPNWGGRGFAVALRGAWPGVQRDFQTWGSDRRNLRLGHVRFFDHTPLVTVASMVAQRGYGDPAPGRRRLRYGALEECLAQLADYATETHASVHMPRIGSGQAGGDWNTIEEMIVRTLCARGIDVLVYDLPHAQSRTSAQTTLDLLSS